MNASADDDRRRIHQQQSLAVPMGLVVLLVVVAAVVLGVAVWLSSSGSVATAAAGIDAPDPAADVPASPEFAPVASSPAPTTPSVVPTPSVAPEPSSPPTGDTSPTPPSPTPAPPSPSPVPPSPPPPTPTPTGTGIPPVQLPADRGMLHVPPVRVEIPKVAVASDLVDLHLNPGGSLQVPKDYDVAGWYADGPYPGDATSPPAIIVGHVDSTTGPAVFFRIRELVKGDEILVTRRDGSVAVFVVRDAVQYPKSNLPTREVYRDRGPSELVLITCTGDFDRDANSYLDNFVVTARLDREASGLGT